MMIRHYLKSWPEFFAPVFDGKKNFELRKDDRHFRVGDIVHLREWEPNTASYSGREIIKEVTFILEGIRSGGITPLHGLSRGYVILAIGDPLSDGRLPHMADEHGPEKLPDDPSMRAVITLSKSLGEVTAQLEAMRKENQSLRLKLRKANVALARVTESKTP